MTLKRILAPVDFSQDACNAARLALAIALRHAGRLTLFHADRLPAFSEHLAQHVGADVWEAYLRQRDEALQPHLHELRDELGGGPIDVALVRDDVVRAIVAYSTENATELIVVAPHGAGQAVQFLVGGTAWDVAAHASCPVLVARHGAAHPLPPEGTFGRPLVALMRHQEGQRALQLAAELATPGARIDVVCALEADEPVALPSLPDASLAPITESRAELRRRLEQLTARLHERGFKSSVELKRGEPSSALMYELESGPNDLVVFARGAPGSSLAALSTPAQRLLRHAPVPVGIVPQ